jgi:UDP-glucose 4-epimerase
MRKAGHVVVGIDLLPAPTTQVVGTIADRELIRTTIRDFEVNAVIHSGALHKPNIETHDSSAFISANVQGTLNLLEESIAPGSKIDRFILTSTTSLMISREISSARSRNAAEALWITEEMTPLLPRNIYGVTKCAAEHLCRLFHELHGLPVLILRASRFFPEEDDMADAISQSGPNTKANELLFRRLSVEDAAECHVAALAKAPEIGFDTFIISAKTPFRREDCKQLSVNAPAVVERYFPQYRRLYARIGWTMFQRIDRVYDSAKASRLLDFECRYGFKEMLDDLETKSGGRE